MIPLYYQIFCNVISTRRPILFNLRCYCRMIYFMLVSYTHFLELLVIYQTYSNISYIFLYVLKITLWSYLARNNLNIDYNPFFTLSYLVITLLLSSPGLTSLVEHLFYKHKTIVCNRQRDSHTCKLYNILYVIVN